MRMARCGALVLSEAKTQAVKAESGRVRWLSHRISPVNLWAVRTVSSVGDSSVRRVSKETRSTGNPAQCSGLHVVDTQQFLGV